MFSYGLNRHVCYVRHMGRINKSDTIHYTGYIVAKTALEKCTRLYDDTQGTIKNTSAFDTESSSGVRREIEK